MGTTAEACVAEEIEVDGTYFAPPERASDDTLREEIALIARNPVIDEVLANVGGLIAVLNEHRQILAVNTQFLAVCGVENATNLLGLRPGEAVHCTHADDGPNGCGTGRWCPTCGAVIAIISGLASDKPVERDCVLEAGTNGTESNLFLRVRACPVTIESQKFILLFLLDRTAEQCHAAMERVFFHDMRNLVQALSVLGEVMEFPNEAKYEERVRRLQLIASRLEKQLEMQSALSGGSATDYRPTVENVSLRQVAQDLQDMFAVHASARGKALEIVGSIPNRQIETDETLVLRILMNMMTNAFEATDKGGSVRLWIEEDDGTVTFAVWNHQEIPPRIARRVFQRNFSTKSDVGRGLGTYSMKLFGEGSLGGKVGFTSSAADGTTFRLALPVRFPSVLPQ